MVKQTESNVRRKAYKTIRSTYYDHVAGEVNLICVIIIQTFVCLSLLYVVSANTMTIQCHNYGYAIDSNKAALSFGQDLSCRDILQLVVNRK